MQCTLALANKKMNKLSISLYLLLILLLYTQCQPSNPPQQDLAALLAAELEQHRDTLTLPSTAACQTIKTLSYLSPAYDTLLVKLEFKDSLQADRVVQVNGVRSDLVRVEYCTPEYVVLNSACSGACWKYTVIFYDKKYLPQSYYYAETVSNAPHLMVHRAGQHEYFEQKTIQDLYTGKKALVELYDCQCFQDMEIAIDNIYLEGDSLFLVCDEEYGSPKTTSLPLSTLH